MIIVISERMIYMNVIKHSRQREAIFKFLASRKDHPTAEFIYTNVKKDYPKISLGTVYRNLALLEELGEIQKISCGGGVEHFDADTSPHYHFLCNKCKSVLEIEMDNINFLNTLAATNFDGIIERHTAFFYGLCPKCKNDNKNEKNY